MTIFHDSLFGNCIEYEYPNTLQAFTVPCHSYTSRKLLTPMQVWFL